MKIGIDASSVVAAFGGGKEKVIMNLLKGFDEAGMDLVVFCNESASEKFVEVCPNARLVYTGMNDKVFIWKLLKGFLFRTFKLRGLVCREKVDILLFPFPATGFSRFNCPTVVIPHDVQYKSRPDENTGYKYKILDMLYKFDFSNRDAIVAISEYVKNEILKHFKKDACKVTVIYNPIEFGDTSHTEADFGVDYIFANNLMHVHKNLGVLIEAFKKLSDNGWPGKLVIAGRIWPGDSNVNMLFDSEVASGRIVYEGYVNDSRMSELLSGACLFVNPSSYEGFGMGAVEAMGMCVPCLLAENSAVKEVTLGRASYYSPAEDSDALADAMTRTILALPSKEYLAETADIIRGAYNYKVAVSKYANLFKALGKSN